MSCCELLCEDCIYLISIGLSILLDTGASQVDINARLTEKIVGVIPTAYSLSHRYAVADVFWGTVSIRESISSSPVSSMGMRLLAP